MNPYQNSRLMRHSRIQQHNIYKNTDKLYDPLRGVLLYPQQTINHSKYVPYAAQVSYVSNQYHTISKQQAQSIKNKIYIPVDKQLIPTHNYDKIRNNRFVIVDTQQQVLGKPISARELQIIRRKGMKRQKIVYDFPQRFVQPPQIEQYRPPKIITSEPILKKTITEVVQQQGPKYRSPMVDNYQRKDDYKYNLYSMIDEPMNLIRQQGCTGWSCPSNQIIASQNYPQSLGIRSLRYK